MKTKAFILVFYLISISNMHVQSQTFKGVISPYVIDISDSNDPIESFLPQSNNGNSEGVFDSNGDLIFYKSGSYIYSRNGVILQGLNTGINIDVEVIQKPQNNTHFYIVYGEIHSEYTDYKYVEIEVNGEVLSLVTEPQLLWHSEYFAIDDAMVLSKPEPNGSSWLYICEPSAIREFRVSYLRIGETDQAYWYDVPCRSEIEYSFDQKRMFFGNDNSNIYWFRMHTNGQIYLWYYLTMNIQYDHIYGLEPSPKDKSIIYISIGDGSNKGIYKCIVNDENNTYILTKLVGSENYYSTNLEFINGYIWGINDSGDKLCRINPYTDEFIADFSIGYTFNTNSYGRYLLPDIENDYLAYVTSVSGVNCAHSGSVNINAYLGNPPYTFLFDNGQNSFTRNGTAGSNTFENILSGEYNVQVEDADGNSLLIENISVEEEGISANLISTTPATCEDVGTVTINAELITGPFEFIFNNGQYTFYGDCGINTFTGLAWGSYDIIIRDHTNHQIILEDVIVDNSEFNYEGSPDITQNTSWDIDYKIDKNITVKNNATLTINNKNINFLITPE